MFVSTRRLNPDGDMNLVFKYIVNNVIMLIAKDPDKTEKIT